MASSRTPLPGGLSLADWIKQKNTAPRNTSTASPEFFNLISKLTGLPGIPQGISPRGQQKKKPGFYSFLSQVSGGKLPAPPSGVKPRKSLIGS